MNLQEAIARAIQEPSYLDALVWIAVWDCDRAVQQSLRTGVLYETTFKVCFEAVTEAWGQSKDPRERRPSPSPEIPPLAVTVETYDAASPHRKIYDPSEAVIIRALLDYPDLKTLFLEPWPTIGLIGLRIPSQSGLRQPGGLVLQGGLRPLLATGILRVKIEDDGTIDVFHWPSTGDPPVHRRYHAAGSP